MGRPSAVPDCCRPHAATRLVRRFGRAREGVAILEFALILPLLLVLYFGTVELCNALANARKVDLLSRTIGDLVSGISTPTRDQVDDIFQSAKVVLLPFDATGSEMVVSAVGVFGTDAGVRVCSSVAAAGATPHRPGVTPPVTVPEALRVDGARLLLVEIRMTYKPIAAEIFARLFGHGIDGLAFSKRMLWPVRFGRRFASEHPEVVLPGGEACPAR